MNTLLVLCILILSALDILSGVVKVKIKRLKYSSAKMSSGLFKKVGNIICLFTAVIIDRYAYDIIGVALFNYVWTYVLAMETLSIYENIGEKELLNKIKGLLKK